MKKNKKKSGNWAYQLSSQNIAYFWEETPKTVALMAIISPDKKLVGGFAGDEANRKAHSYARLCPQTEYTQSVVDTLRKVNCGALITGLNCPELEESLTAFYGMKITNQTLSNQGIGGACDVRLAFFEAHGLTSMIDEKDQKCPFWAFLGTVLSVQGRANFNSAGYGGNEKSRNSTVSAVCNRTKYTTVKSTRKGGVPFKSTISFQSAYSYINKMLTVYKQLV